MCSQFHPSAPVRPLAAVAFALVLWAGCQPACAGDFSVTQGYNDGIGTKAYNSGAGTLGLLSADARWFWYLNFAQPGYYEVSARVAVSAANAGATLQVGHYATQHNGPGSYALTNLAATDPSANVNPQWQSLGTVWVPSPGLQFFFAQVPTAPTGDPGLLYAIRVTGPGPITVDPTWTVRSSACDIYFTPGGSTRKAFYAEMVSRPLPVPAINGMHTVINTPSGYMGNNDTCFQSLWMANNTLPDVLVAAGSSRVYTHEGTGSTITFNDFSLDPTRRRRSLNIAVSDGSTNTLATFLTSEYGQRWYFCGRMRQATSASAGSSGFLENPSVFNGHLNWRSCAWGNVWAYGSESGGANAWWANTTIRGHLRGPSPAALPGVTGVYPYGKVRQRQDMMEMIIGGLIPITQNDTYLYNMPMTTPDLPALNLAYHLQAPEVVNQAAHATVSAVYSDATTLKSKIRDPFSSLNFTYAKVSGPGWLSVSSTGTLSGTPPAGSAGQNIFIVQATDPNAGLSGQFTVGVYVRASGGANNAPAFQYVVPVKQTIWTLDDPNLIQLPVIDPDTTNHSFSITAGNGGGQFGFSGDWLVKTAALTPGTSYPLTIQVSDTNTPALTSTVSVTVIAATGDGKGGATKDIWFNVAGDPALTNLLNEPRYPNSPDQANATRDLRDDTVALSSGYRVTGYLYPPTSGSYTFYMDPGSDTDGEFRVSTTEYPANLVLRATTSGTSGTVSLTAGQRYFIQMLVMCDGYTGSRMFNVDWSGPGIARQTIPAANLSPERYVTPQLWSGTNTLREVVTGESYFENLRTKIDTIHLWDVLTCQKVSGPAWLGISADGLLTGTPGPGDAGTQVFVIRATAPGGLLDEAAFSVNVISNQAPQFSTNLIVLPNLNEGTEITGTLAGYATDANVGPRLGLGDRLTLAIVSGPPWLGVEPTGELFGKPGGPHIGTNLFNVRVTDLGGLSATGQLQVVITDAPNTPVFTVNPMTFALLSGEAINGSLASYAYDPDAGEVLTFQKLSGPAWLTVATNGGLSGTPTVANLGSNVFSVRVTDSTARTSTGTVLVTVNDGQFFVYEGFNANSGALITNHTTGIGWSGPWAGTVTGAAGFNINSGNTGFGTLPVTGRSVSNGTNSSVTYTRAMSQTIQVGDTGGYPEAWVSGVIALAGTAPGQGIEVGLGSAASFGKNVNGALGLKVNGTWFYATNSGGSATSISPTGSYLYVLRLFATNGNTEAMLYLGNNTGMNLSSPANFPYKTGVTIAGTVSFNSMSLWVNKPDPQDVNIDEIRVGSTYAQVVPIGMTNAPVFNANPLVKPAAALSVPYVESIAGDVTDPDAGDVQVFAKLSGPSWLSVGSSGILTGTPLGPNLGTNDFSVQVTDAAGNPATTTLRIVVGYAPQFTNNPIMRLAPAALPWTNTIAGEATDFTPGDVLTYSKVSGPAWLNIAASGALTGTPAITNAGLNVFTVRVTDLAGLTGETTLWVEVPSDQLLAYESFDGPNGTDVAGTTGGQGWSGAWTGDTAWDFTTPGITFSNLPTAGLKSIIGGQDTTISRTMSQTVTVGDLPGERGEIWITALMDLRSVTAVGHYVQTRLWNGGTYLGFFGKQVNSSIGFDLGGSGFQAVAPSSGSSGASIEGVWFLALRLLNDGTATDITLFAAKAGETFDLLNPGTFPHQVQTNVNGKITFDKLGFIRHNNTNSYVDELRVGTTYAANIGRATQVASYTLSYLAGTGGTISGPTPQIVNEAASGSEVTAVPDSGYAFVNWSDAITDNPRTDANVTSNITVTANFVLVAPPVIVPGGVNVSGGNFNFQFTGTVGQHYRVEYTPVLPARGPWQTVTDILSLATSPFAVSTPTTNAMGFYRVGLVP